MSSRVGGGACGDGLRGHPAGAVRVLTRRGNHSAFSGYRFTPSDYSSCRCLTCGAYWRTNAAYVDALPDATDEERWTSADRGAVGKSA